MHSLLQRQLKKYGSPTDGRPENWRQFVAEVDQTYRQFDEDRRMLERSLELSSDELLEANAQMQAIYDTAPVSILQEDWSEVVTVIEQLRERGVRDFGAFFRDHPEMVLEAARAVRIREVNQWTLETFGSQCKAAMLGAFERIFAPSDALPELRRELTALAQGERVYRTERTLTTLEGGKIHGLLAMNFPAPGGGAGNVLVSVVDLTERQRAEEALRRSEEHYRLLCDTMLQGVVYQDPEGQILSMNPAARRILGQEPAEIGGGPLPEGAATGASGLSVPGWEQPSLVALDTGREVRDEVMAVYNPRENARRWINIRAVPLFRPGEPNPYEVYTIFDDITDRWRNERQIDRQTQILRGINRIFHETLTCQTDTEVGAVYLEVSRELTGSPLGFVEVVDEAGHWQALAGSRAGEETNSAKLAGLPSVVGGHFGSRAATMAEVRIVNCLEPPPDHGSPPLELPMMRFLSVPLSESVHPVGLLVLANKASDYTEEDRHASEALAPAFVEALSRKRAQRAVDELHAQLAHRARALEEAYKELESFSYSVSHDLRAPLRSIDGFSRILLEDYADKLDAEGQESLHTVRAASQRMGQLIDDILQLSRISRSGMRATPFDLSALVREVAAELRAADPQRSVEFIIEENLFAPADPRLMRIALENLLGNAWKFTGQQSAPRIEFGRAAAADAPVLFVRDNGVGFDMANSRKLFGAFQRLHTTAEFPGSGIGLATVQRVIHRHGGQVWGEGETGRGATFYFSLPNAAHSP